MGNTTTRHKREGLTPRQERAAELLSCGWLSKEAARELRVTPETICHWRNLPAFQELCDKFRSEAMYRTIDRFRSLHLLAADTLASAMVSPDTPPAAKIRAALGIYAAGNLSDKTSAIWDVNAEHRKLNKGRDAQEAVELSNLVEGLKRLATEGKMQRHAAYPDGETEIERMDRMFSSMQ